MGLANAITLGRGLVTFGLWGLLVLTGPFPGSGTWWAALGIFVVAAATDALDGMVARRRGETSAFGRMADPLVDKLLILGTMVVLLGLPAVHDVLPTWAVVLVLTREMVVTAVRGAVEGRQIPFGASWSGKWKMLAQCLAIGGVLAFGAGMDLAVAALPGLSSLPGGEAQWNVAFGLVLLAVVLTVVSGVRYVHRAMGLLRGA